ncbi:MAG TPA: PD-(D/E)XK nuclease family protein [Devosia sp.]|jgi:hypothetical protein|nr:PD-(D/E)XK nuclease family protein [Devosia sp.]
MAGPLAASRRRGDALDIWEVASLSRDEVRTARVLTWLLDPHGSHGAGDAYLQALWAELEGERILNFALEGPQRTLRENYPLGDLQNRVDVEAIGANFLLFIEVKIDAAEGVDQVARYADLAAKKAAILRRPNWAVLYLSQRAPEQQSERCLHLRWRTVAQAIRSASKAMDANDFSTRLALGFARHVSQLH